MPATDGDKLSFLKAIVSEAAGTTVRVVMEEVGGYIGEKQPGSVMFEFGRGVGFFHGALMALGCRLELVRPQTWQKVLGLGISGRQRSPPGASEEERHRIQIVNQRIKREWKNKLKEEAEKLYPALKVTLKTCDSLLLLEYANRTRLPF